MKTLSEFSQKKMLHPAIKNMWLKSLRSDKYLQGREQLVVCPIEDYDVPKFCCLGVGCDLFLPRKEFENNGTPPEYAEAPNFKRYGNFLTWLNNQITGNQRQRIFNYIDSISQKERSLLLGKKSKDMIKTYIDHNLYNATYESVLITLNDNIGLTFEQIAYVIENILTEEDASSIQP